MRGGSVKALINRGYPTGNDLDLGARQSLVVLIAKVEKPV